MIAPKLAIGRSTCLLQQARPCAAGDHLLEQGAGLRVPSCEVQRFDEPKGAEIKRRLGQAEIVLGRIAKHVRTAAQGFLDHVQRIAEAGIVRSEEHTSELQSLMRISYDVFCLKKK